MTYRTEEERKAAKKASKSRYLAKLKEKRLLDGWVDGRTLRTKKTLSKEEKLLHSAKFRAKRKGIPFELSVEDIVIPDLCPVLGIPIKLDNTKTAPDSPSIDRIDSEKGYTPENIKIISWRANKLKGDATLKESFLIFQYMKILSEKKA